MSQTERELQPLLDQEQLEMLGADGSPESMELIEELKSLFESENEDSIQRLNAYLGEDQFSDLSKLAHALAGSASNVGLLRLSLAARELEKSAREEDKKSCKELLQEVERLLSESLQALSTFIRC